MLTAAGLRLEEGGSHTKVYRGDTFVAVVSRQREISERIVREIEKQTGVQLRR
ncbi:hypothetical protein [Jannaschia sp. LMIT008]|uniref:hypothetical protein n=1 Tax=Jannaschia maritima TaxID=3032585 RepID=UPI0028128DE3|nr:hypothetical protein [Jannaschia sp. LMIT008]